jgi:hypothetical protein
MNRLTRGAPGTWIYLFTLLVTQLTLTTVDERIGRKLVLSESTNLHNMARAPIQVLLGSAFWTDTTPWLTYLSFAGLLAVMVPVERWLGTWRWLVTVACGHLGATLATLAVTGWALSRGWAHPGVTEISDVGVSYGLFACAGVLTYRFPRRAARWSWLLAVLAGLAVAFALRHQVAELGHLCAFGIGLALRVLVPAARLTRTTGPAEPGGLGELGARSRARRWGRRITVRPHRTDQPVPPAPPVLGA